MPNPPECRSLGKHCREVRITIRISDVTDETQTLQDASVTWITGHSERITYGRAYLEDDEIRVDAIVHVPCKHLRTPDGNPGIRPDGMAVPSRNGTSPEVRCAVHGFRGAVPSSSQLGSESRANVRLNDGRFAIYYKGKHRTMDLRLKRSAKRAPPEVQAKNPCATAPCYTGDNTRGAACCRDFNLELALPRSQPHKEALLRARAAPYLCKVKRDGDDTMECEVISACGYLNDDGITCVLHERTLPNGQRAKPSLCYEWPTLEEDETGHGGCKLL
jgi:hypothetical protein